MMVRTGEEMTVAIVPAKLKSTRLPDKNWRTFMHGESLTERKFLMAIGSGYFSHTVLSIDFPRSDVGFLKLDKNKYALTHSQGWSVRKRPRLMVDESAEVVLDALESVKAFPRDIYCLLQPTSPHVMKESVLKAIHAVQAHETQVVSVNPAYKPNGAIYAGRVEHLKKYHDFYRPLVTPLVLNWLESIDIDYHYDFEIAKGVLE